MLPKASLVVIASRIRRHGDRVPGMPIGRNGPTTSCHVQYSRISARRVPADDGRSLSSLDPQRIGRSTDRRVARLHPGQGTPRLLESLERSGMARPAGRGRRTHQTEDAGRQNCKSGSPKFSFSAGSSRHVTGRCNSPAVGGWSSPRVFENSWASSRAERSKLSGRPFASKSGTPRRGSSISNAACRDSGGSSIDYQRRVGACTCLRKRTFHARSGGSVEARAKTCYPVGAASHQGGLFRAYDVPSHLFPDRAWI